MYCRNCGHKLSDNVSYCPGCGTKVMSPVRRQYNELITKAISGDDAAFNTLIKTIEPMGYFYARSISGDDYIAKEAFQLSCIQLNKSLSSLKDLDSFEGWYKRIVRNKTLDLLKSNNKEISFSSFDSDSDNSFEYNVQEERIEYQPELNFSRQEKERMISEILSSLNDNQRIPIMMYFYEGMKIKEIAENLNISENTIKTRLTAAKNNIKDKVLIIQKRDGIRLYNVTPVGFFMWLLKDYSLESTLSTAALAASATTAATSITAAATASTAKFTSTLLGKTIIGLALAGTVATTGIVVANNIRNNETSIDESSDETDIQHKNDEKADEGIENLSDDSRQQENISRKTVTKETTYASGVLCDVKEYSYDEQGNMTGAIQTNTYSNVEEVYYYDKDNNLYKRTYKSPETTYEVTISYTYDDKGNIKHSTVKFSDGYVIESVDYEYDSKNRLIKGPCDGYDCYVAGWFEYEYDDRDNIVKITHYADDNGMHKPYIMGAYDYKYDEHGNVVEMKDGFLDNFTYTYEYEYDEDGNILKKKEVYKEVPGYERVTYYEYEER